MITWFFFMQRLSYILLIAALAGVLGSGAGICAGPQSGSGAVINTQEAERESTRTARSIKWETSLDKAKESAQQYNKPIFWVHMLGNIDGYT